MLSPLQRQSLLGQGGRAGGTRASSKLTTPSPAPLVLVAPPPVHCARRRIGGAAPRSASVIATVVAVAAGGVTIGAANRFSQLGSDCQVDASGCLELGARGSSRSTTPPIHCQGAGRRRVAVATLTIDLDVLRHRRR